MGAVAQLVGDETTHSVGAPSPTVLLERVKAGCEESWLLLVDQHLRMVHAICAGYGLAPRGAAEINQLVWLRLAEHLARIRTPEAVGGWIAATTRGFCEDERWSADRNGYAAARVGMRPPGDHRRHGVASAFGRLGAQCQRLLRLAATTPRPSDEDMGAALDLSSRRVEPTCTACLRRLRRMVGSDDDVLAELRTLMDTNEGVPGEWRVAARVAFGWLALDVTVAELAYDSTTIDHTTRREARFVTHEAEVELSIGAKGDEVLLRGELVSISPAKVTVRWPGGELSTPTDETGAFRFHDLPRAPVYVQVDCEKPFKTGWILP